MPYYLQEKRFANIPARRNVKRQKLDVQLGKSVAAVRESSSSESENEIQDAQTNDSSGDEQIEDVTEEETEYYSVEKEHINTGKFLLVNVLGGARKKINYRYAAVVQNIVDVKGMKPKTEKLLNWLKTTNLQLTLITLLLFFRIPISKNVMARSSFIRLTKKWM